MLSLIYKKMRVIFYCQSNYPHVKTHSNVCISGEIAPRNGKQATIACTYIILLSIIIDEVDLVQEQQPIHTHSYETATPKCVERPIKQFHCIENFFSTTFIDSINFSNHRCVYLFRPSSVERESLSGRITRVNSAQAQAQAHTHIITNSYHNTFRMLKYQYILYGNYCLMATQITSFSSMFLSPAINDLSFSTCSILIYRNGITFLLWPAFDSPTQ